MFVFYIAIIAFLGLFILMFKPDTGTERSLDNLYHWMGELLGKYWPYVLTTIFVLLLIILGMIRSRLVVNIDNETGGALLKINAMMIICYAFIVTWRWRMNYIDDPGIEYYVELSFICLLLMGNMYLLVH